MSERVVTRNFLTIGSGEVVARVLSFIASVYLARVLGAEVYGAIAFAMAILLYFNRAADGGLDLIGMREVARNHAEASRIAGPLIAFRLAASALLTLLLAAGALVWLPRRDALVLALFAVTLVPIGASTRWIHLGLEKSKLAAISRVIGELLGLALILLLVRSPDDFLTVPLANLAAGSLTAALLAWWLRGLGVHLTLRWDWAVVRPLLLRSYPVVLAALLGLLVFNSDLIMLRVFRDARTAGYYAAAYTPVSLAIAVGQAYRMSLLPALTRLGTSGGQHELYQTALAHVFAAVVPAVIGGCILAPLVVPLVFGEQYMPAVAVLQVLIWAIPLSQLKEAPVAALVSHALEHRLLHLNAMGTVVSIAMNLVLIPRYGMMGAAITTLVTEGARTALAFVFAHGAGFPLPAGRRFWRVAVAGVAMAGLLIVLRRHGLWAAAIPGILGYLTVLVALGAIRIQRGRWPSLRV
ncbi:MAG: flippase [Anaerolineae bacterium]|nr:flippase [Gemmatimonadaceae bacterium]